MHTDKNGALQIELQLDKEKLPESQCAFISTPCRANGDKPDFEKISRTHDVVAGVLRAGVGHNLLRYRVFNTEVCAHDGSVPYSDIGSITNIPQAGDGPFFMEFVWNDAKSIIQELRSAEVATKRRIELALEYFQNGIESDRGFLDIWTACEILCEGKRADEMKKRLQKFYGFPDRKYVESKLGFKTFDSHLRLRRLLLVRSGFLQTSPRGFALAAV
jgi:hypothetical protein